jgi:hypothetical protein
MTKKDYIIIAKAIKNLDASQNAKVKFIEALLPALLADNPRFDAQRFANAALG